MTTTIYRNYGCLAAEKRCVYTHKVPAETAVTYDRLIVETPDGWDAYETPAEDIVLTPPDGIPSLLREILCGDEYPCVLRISKDGSGYPVRLRVVEG